MSVIENTGSEGLINPQIASLSLSLSFSFALEFSLFLFVSRVSRIAGVTVCL